MRVVLLVGLLGVFFFLLGGSFGLCGLLVGLFLIPFAGGGEVVEVKRRFVPPSPVVFEFAVAPPALELGAPGVFGRGVVEIPRVVAGVHRERLGSLVVIVDRPLVAVGQEFLAGGCLGLFLLFLLQLLDDAVHHLALLLGRHGREPQQRILQLHILRVQRQLVEHIAAALEHSVVWPRLRQLRHGLGVAWLRLGVVMLGEIERAECDLRYGLLDARTGGFLHRLLVVGYSLGCIAARQVEIADGVVYLVEVFLVAVVARHTAQGFHLLGDVGAGEYLALLDAGVELGAVRSRRAAAGFAVVFVSQLFMAHQLLNLPHQEVQARLLRSRGQLQGFGEHRLGLVVEFLLDQQVGVSGVVQLTDGLRGQLVGLDAVEDALGFEKPVHGAVGAGLPEFGFEHSARQP